MSKPEGWTKFSNSTKWHYLRGGTSLCGKFMALGNPATELGNDESPDNCAACKRKLRAERAKAQG